MSLTPSTLGTVKALLLDLDAAKAEALLRPLVENPAWTALSGRRLGQFDAPGGLQL